MIRHCALTFTKQATETQIRLLLQQRELEAAIPESEFVGSSLSDTLYRLVRTGYTKQAAKIRSDFKVPDKRFWWIQIKALAMARNWPDLEALANSKKSPIGYRVAQPSFLFLLSPVAFLNRAIIRKAASNELP